MSTDAPAVGGEHKPNIKNEGSGNTVIGQHNNQNARKLIKKDRFHGAHPDLSGFVFKSRTTQTNQIANFTAVNVRIRALVGQQFDPYVLESIEKMQAVLPPEPTIMMESDGSVSKMEEIKYGKKYD